jgi:hypothetical protein
MCFGAISGLARRLELFESGGIDLSPPVFQVRARSDQTE